MEAPYKSQYKRFMPPSLYGNRSVKYFTILIIQQKYNTKNSSTKKQLMEQPKLNLFKSLINSVEIRRELNNTK